MPLQVSACFYIAVKLVNFYGLLAMKPFKAITTYRGNGNPATSLSQLKVDEALYIKPHSRHPVRTCKAPWAAWGPPEDTLKISRNILWR